MISDNTNKQNDPSNAVISFGNIPRQIRSDGGPQSQLAGFPVNLLHDLRVNYIDELASFPTGHYDDAVDSTTQALNLFRERTGVRASFIPGGGNSAANHGASSGT